MFVSEGVRFETFVMHLIGVHSRRKAFIDNTYAFTAPTSGFLNMSSLSSLNTKYKLYLYIITNAYLKLFRGAQS